MEKPDFKALRIQKRCDVFNRFHGHCAYCGVAFHGFEEMHMGHVVAKRDGGTDDAANLMPCCLHCHNLRNEPFVLRIAIAMRGTALESILKPQQAAALFALGHDLGLVPDLFLFEQRIVDHLLQEETKE